MTSQSASLRSVIICACALLMLSFGFRAGFGLFMQPISVANGWDRDVLSLALALQNLVWGFAAVVAGGLADRFGNLKVLLAGVAFYAIGMSTMAFAHSPLAMILTAGVLVGIGVAGTSFGIVLPALARAVPPERRGWAMGLGTAAGSFGQFLVVPLMQQLVDFSGWFMALQWLSLAACLMAALAIPLAPYGGASQSQGQVIDIPLKDVLTRALKLRSYQLLTLGFFVCGFHVAFITVHMPGYLVDLGFDPKVGAWSISLIGLCNVIGAYVAGIQCGRQPMRKILAFIYLGRGVAIALFLWLPISLGSILMFSACMGFLWLATVPPTSGLVAVFFGTRYMTFLYSIVFLSHQLGSFIGVWLGGWLYSHYESYMGIWILGIILSLVAAALHWPIREEDASASLQPA